MKNAILAYNFRLQLNKKKEPLMMFELVLVAARTLVVMLLLSSFLKEDWRRYGRNDQDSSL